MQLPSNLLHSAFSEIDVIESGNKLIITYITMGKAEGEGWETGIAVDASVSMSDAFGKGLKGSVPDDIKNKYLKKGWINTRHHDGRTVHYWTPDAFKDAIRNGYLIPTKNIIESEARKFSSYLAENLDEDGGTDIIYWACGKEGKDIEEYGELDSMSCSTMEFKGPQKYNFGQATHLLPALKYFESKYNKAKKGFFIFITDGQIDDLDNVKIFTTNLAEKIEAGKRNPFKAVLIGVGEEVNEQQMIELDDLDTGTNVDIWDHKIVQEMKDILEIFAELVDENKIIAPFGVIKDSNGNIVKKFNDGVPAKGSFELPLNSSFFTFEVEGQIIKQHIVKP